MSPVPMGMPWRVAASPGTLGRDVQRRGTERGPPRPHRGDGDTVVPPGRGCWPRLPYVLEQWPRASPLSAAPAPGGWRRCGSRTPTAAARVSRHGRRVLLPPPRQRSRRGHGDLGGLISPVGCRGSRGEAGGPALGGHGMSRALKRSLLGKDPRLGWDGDSGRRGPKGNPGRDSTSSPCTEQGHGRGARHGLIPTWPGCSSPWCHGGGCGVVVGPPRSSCAPEQRCCLGATAEEEGAAKNRGGQPKGSRLVIYLLPAC